MKLCRNLRLIAITWMIFAILFAGSGEKIWMAIGIILSSVYYLAAMIIERIDAIDDRDTIQIGSMKMPASRAFEGKAKKDLA